MPPASETPAALSPDEFKPFKLIAKEDKTPNTYMYRFELPDNKVSGIFTASCLVTKAMVKEKPDDASAEAVVRPYTPTSAPDARGYLDLVVKTYPNGKMSSHMAGLKIGETLEMKGPISKYPYQANSKQSIGMVAGGTGITPMLQVIDAILSNPDDHTSVSLVYANQTESDIILKDGIDEFAKQYPDKFKVYYVVAKPSVESAWKGGVGFVTKEILEAQLPSPCPDTVVMVCGPPGMMKAVSGDKAPDKSQGEVEGLLKELGFSKDNVFKF
ncbi:hypothetical protein FOA52_011997 [Chlamydomonas sp. UWO 241]|nr:hypothetical protein FOA52_011997 [Chlamydomonas sp. UWO 241]